MVTNSSVWPLEPLQGLQQPEKQAVVWDECQSHVDQAQKNTLAGKKQPNTPALLSSEITSWEESNGPSKTWGYKH